MYVCELFFMMQTTPDDYKVIMRNGFLAMDAEMRKKQSDNDNDRSGSTAITAFVTPNHIIVANCGFVLLRALTVRRFSVCSIS